MSYTEQRRLKKVNVEEVWLNDLDPSWISEGDDNAEALTVEVWIEEFPIR